MSKPDEEFLDQAKGILKRVPGTKRLNEIRHDILRIHELLDLIKEKRIVVLRPYSEMEMDTAVPHEIVHDVVKDLLQVYGTVHLRRTTAAAIGCPAGAILLYAPLALLRIPVSHDEYLAAVGPKTRNMIRKAERQGYEYKEFVWNDHLDEIFEINTSKEVRQSAPMRGWYTEPVQPRYHSTEELRYRKYYGAFKDGKLHAYLHVVLCGNFAFFRHFMGHAQHLTYGIMNGLVSYAVHEHIGDPKIRWLKYGDLSRESSSMHSFRKHAGFEGYVILFDMEGDQELLTCAEQMVKTWWRI